MVAVVVLNLQFEPSIWWSRSRKWGDHVSGTRYNALVQKNIQGRKEAVVTVGWSPAGVPICTTLIKLQRHTEVVMDNNQSITT